MVMRHRLNIAMSFMDACGCAKRQYGISNQPHGKKDRFNEEAFEKALMGLGLRFSRSWKRESKKQAYPCTLQTYIRNKIHHPENQENNGVFNTDDLRQSIDEMRSLLLG